MTLFDVPIFRLADMRTVVRRDDMLRVTRDAFIQHAEGKVVSPLPGQLSFEEPPGDCHIEFGYIRGGSIFVIKVAIGFYDNPTQGLPSNNGMVLVFDAKTGMTRAILQDEGWLTSWRTAAAGALAAQAGAPANVTAIGIVGAGHQAELQAQWVSALLGVKRVWIWARNKDKAVPVVDRLRRQGLDASAADSVDRLFGECSVVLTCTPAAAPVVPDSVVRAGTHIVALGSDGPGKQELDAKILARAAAIVTDDHVQCPAYGEFYHAVSAGHIAADCDLLLGRVLADEAIVRKTDRDIIVADLTCLPAQDVAIATLVVGLLERKTGL
jgi:ornithine cyclodeaminase